jgi:tetratricopeptide (TPR) repeat protein
MPPWKPEPGFGQFAGERRLNAAQIAAFREWLVEGAPAGDLRQTPTPPTWNDEWLLGKPDLVIRLSAPYRLDPTGPDQLRNFVIPIPTTVRRYVRAWEFRPSSSTVHHATMLLDSTRASRRRDENDPQPGYDGLIPLSARNPEGYFLGWTPGQQPYLAPEQMAWPLDPETDLIAMMHLKPSGQPEVVDASIALYFSTGPPAVAPVMIRLNRQDIDIPAGASRYTVRDSYTLPVPVTVFGVQPHAHNLAREVRAFATLPDGTTKWLLYIREWDFHWQDAYRFATPMPLPAGTQLSLEFTYDNSEANHANPSRPPRRVTYGQRTLDEMGDLWIQVVPDRRADAGMLTAELQRKLLPQNISGLQMMLNADPENVGLHDDLGVLFTEAGDLERAASQFAESLRLRPDAPAAHYNVGNALLNVRRWSEAAGHFREALALSPEYGLAHQGLAMALQGEGRYDDALGSFVRAVRLMPTADAHYNVGVLQQARGDVADALAHYHEAVRLNPTFPEPHFALGLLAVRRGESRRAAAAFGQALDLRSEWTAARLQLAWLRAASRDGTVRNPHEAITLAERAVTDLGNQNASALDVLAAAFAAAGEFPRAIVTARRALELLKTEGDPGLVAAVEERLSLYEQRRPYVERAW